MSIWIELNEADHLRRRVPCRIFTSNGTAPDTGAQGDAVIMAVNSFVTISLSSSLTAVHASNGMYMEQLSQSNVSVLGTHMLYHIAGDFPQHIATVQVVNSNPFSTLSSFSDVTLRAITHSGATVQGLSNYANISNVTLAAGTHSNVTIQGLSNYANISNVTLAAGTHSNVTIQGVTRLNSSVTLNAGNHSGATVDGVLFVGTAGMRSLASSYLSTDLGASRYVQQAFEVLRNRVLISGSTMTVYQTDDTTSSWTASVTTGTNTITQIDPGGA